jgi:hypothetical protein
VVIAPIVEGKGEEDALPILIRKIAQERGVYPRIAKPFRLDAGKMMKPDELARAISFQSTRVGPVGGVLVLRDGDDKNMTCVDIADRLRAASSTGVNARVEVVVAIQEYESWFLASMDSLRSHSSVRDDAEYLGDPESPRDAKGRLRDMMTESYRETLHQARFSSLIDLQQAGPRSRSLRRLIHAVELLCGTSGVRE